MTTKQADRWILRLAGAALVICAVMLLGGCVSTKADTIQGEHANFNRTTVEDVAKEGKTHAEELALIAKNVQMELLRRDDAREQEVARTKEKALASRDNYWIRVMATESWYNRQVAKATSHEKALDEAAKGFTQQAAMTLKAGEIPTALATDSLNAALTAAPAIYAAFSPGPVSAESPPAESTPTVPTDAAVK